MKLSNLGLHACALLLSAGLLACSGQATPTPALAEAAPAAAAGPQATAASAPAAADANAVAAATAEPAGNGRNWLAFGAGTVVVSQTSQSASSDSGARQLIDESGFAWMTAEGQVADQGVTLELPARTTFTSFEFDTAYPTYLDGSSAKDVRVEVSDTSATDGFQPVVEATLKDSDSKGGVDDQVFKVSQSLPARWVRYTAKDNFGSKRFILTKELSGYGTQEPRAPIANVSGTYRMESISELHLKQDGNAIIGCYAEDEGIVEGTIDGRTLTLVGSGKTDRAKGEKRYFIAMNAVDGGKTLLSTWWSWSATPVAKSYDRFYIGKKTSEEIGNCPHLANLDGSQDVVKDAIEQDLENDGKAILYGINFDFNSDVIRAESRPTLDKVAAILKARADWKFFVDGHTDGIGGQAFNQGLSERRAASVVAYLKNAGVDAARLSPRGFGLSKPIAPNDSEAERAQNRRVELVKQ